jgi:prepilin-type processing-associated H-X9-DG protein
MAQSPGPTEGELQPLDYAPRTRPSRRWASRIIGSVIVLGGLLLVIWVLRPAFSRPRDGSVRLDCARNMRQIGEAIAMYANGHGGKFPDDLQTIFETGEVTTAVFVCPCTKDVPAPTGPTTRATAAGLMRPGHVSYIYLGKGLSAESATEDTVLLYEPLSNHAGDGMNVLFGDFHVEWLPAAEASTILKQVAAKRFPVRYPLTQPVTTSSAG